MLVLVAMTYHIYRTVYGWLGQVSDVNLTYMFRSTLVDNVNGSISIFPFTATTIHLSSRPRLVTLLWRVLSPPSLQQIPENLYIFFSSTENHIFQITDIDVIRCHALIESLVDSCFN
jgi:hypothetical protein